MAAAGLASEFNDYVLQLLVQLPKSMPKYAFQFQSFAVHYESETKANPFYGLEKFDEALKDTAKDIKSPMADLDVLKAFQKLIPGIQQDLTPKTRECVLQYVGELTLLHSKWILQKGEQKHDKMHALFHAILTQDYSKLPPGEVEIIQTVTSFLKEKEKEKGRPLNLQNPEDLREFHAQLLSLKEILNAQQEKQICPGPREK